MRKFSFFHHMSDTKRLVFTAMFTALGVMLSYITAHAFGPQLGLGAIILPMHLPVLLCGLLCGPVYGFLCGVLAPSLSNLLTQMPLAYPMLPIMLAELSIYGAVSGLLFKKFKLPLFIALPGAMVAGRIGYGIVFAVLFALNPGLKALTVWAALLTGLPGILAQIIIIPAIIRAVLPAARVKKRTFSD